MPNITAMVQITINKFLHENIYSHRGTSYTRLTLVWQYFGTLICELFLEIIRYYEDKLDFFYYADNLKLSTIVGTIQ